MVVCLYVEIIHELKLVDYLQILADKPWYNYYKSHALSHCDYVTGDNSLANAPGLSPHTGGQTGNNLLAKPRGVSSRASGQTVV